MTALIPLGACDAPGAAPIEEPLTVAAPAWVNAGSLIADDGAVLGVGAVSGIRNPALQRTTADNRARAEIAKLYKVTQTELKADDGSARTLRTETSRALLGVQIVDHWTDPADGTLYALARLDR